MRKSFFKKIISALLAASVSTSLAVSSVAASEQKTASGNVGFIELTPAQKEYWANVEKEPSPILNPTTPFEVYNARCGEMPNIDVNSRTSSNSMTRAASWQTVSGTFTFYTQRPNGCPNCGTIAGCWHEQACVSASVQMALSPLGGTVPSLYTVGSTIGVPTNLAYAADYLNGLQVVKNRGKYAFKPLDTQTQTTVQYNLSDGIMRYNLIPIVGVRAQTSVGYALNTSGHAVVVRYVMSDMSKFGLRDPWARSEAAGIVDRTTAGIWSDFSSTPAGQLIF